MSRMYFEKGGAPLAGEKKVMVATTAYDTPDAAYTHSIALSRQALDCYGIASAYLLLSGNCHVDDARNTVVREFLKTDCDELIFIDADVCWQPQDLVRLAEFSCDIVGGVYPHRSERAQNSMPVRAIDADNIEFDENGLIEVAGLPTGFLKIKRRVFKQMLEAGVIPSATNSHGEKLDLFFERRIHQGRRMGGDIAFCEVWRGMGGECFAAANIRLGHVAKTVIYDSLRSFLRRSEGQTLEYVTDKIRAKTYTMDDLAEAVRFTDNPWGAPVDVLQIAIGMAANANGPILEIGSGLSTLLMAAAAPNHLVIAIENDPFYIAQLQHWAAQTKITNALIIEAPVSDGWYQVAEADKFNLRKEFDFCFVDGPPRRLGNRATALEKIGTKVSKWLFDDANSDALRQQLEQWAAMNGYRFMYEGGRTAAIVPPGG